VSGSKIEAAKEYLEPRQGGYRSRDCGGVEGVRPHASPYPADAVFGLIVVAAVDRLIPDTTRAWGEATCDLAVGFDSPRSAAGNSIVSNPHFPSCIARGLNRPMIGKQSGGQQQLR
jgi:hypothetical protein